MLTGSDSYVHVSQHLYISKNSLVFGSDVDDTITWRWTADANYSTHSAYRIQF